MLIYAIDLMIGFNGYDLLAAIVVGAGVVYSAVGEFKIRGAIK